MIKSWKNSSFYTFTVIIISLIIIFLVKYFSRNSTFWNDDLFFCTYDIGENIFDCLFGKERMSHGGGYIGIFLCKFLSFGLPNLMHINPSDFIVDIESIIKGIFSFIILMLLSKFSTVYFRYLKIYIAFYFFVTAYFFYSVFSSDSWVLGINYNYYRYFFSLLFFCIFWHFILKNIVVDSKKVSKFKLFGICLCGYVIGTSSEILFFSSCCISTLIIIYNIIFKKTSLKYILNKNFYFPVLSLFIGTLMFTTSWGFKDVAFNQRGLSILNLQPDIVNEFLIYFFKICFLNEIIYWILFLAITVICFYMGIKKGELKKLTFSLIFEISILLVMFSLVLCGKNGDMSIIESSKFYVTHRNIVFLYKMLIIIPFAINISYLLKNLKIIRTVLGLFIISGIILAVISVKMSENYYISNKFMCQLRTMNYMAEKILRFYFLQGKVPTIPTYMVNPDKYYFNVWVYNDFEKKCYKDSRLLTNYALIYKQDIKNLEFCIGDNALMDFYNDGGKFSSDEMSDIMFSRLFDENFVLNKEQKIN